MKDFRCLLKRDESNPTCIAMLKRIYIGDYELSIQASEYHYSTPRKNLSNLFDYETMEVAVFKSEVWVNVAKDSFFNEWSERHEFLESYDGMVAAYIPIKMIQSFCNYIEEKSNA
ncbi:hypothetical protein ACV3YD_15005 [Clostridium perfringens]